MGRLGRGTLLESASIGDSHAPVRTARSRRGDAQEPHRRLADVPVLVARGAPDALAPRSPRQPRRRRRGARDDRGERGRGARPHLSGRQRHLARLAGRGVGARSRAFIAEQGAVPGMQLAHAGRKASTAVPWEGGKGLYAGAGRVAPDARAERRSPSTTGTRCPTAMTIAGDRRRRARVRERREARARRGVPGPRDPRRARLPAPRVPLAAQQPSHRRLRRLVREPHPLPPARRRRGPRRRCPEPLPLLLRISATDWADGGWDLEQSCALVEALKRDGRRPSSTSRAAAWCRRRRSPWGPATRRRSRPRFAGAPASPPGAVGMITVARAGRSHHPSGQADLVSLAREMLRDPYWPRRAARALGVKIDGPVQYERAR